MQAGLMTGLGLATGGGVLGVMLLMSGDVEREADALGKAWARAPQPGACDAVELPEGAKILSPPAQAGSHCVVELPAQARLDDVAAAGPAPTRQTAAAPAANPSAAVGRPAKRASSAPTYIRISKPEPKPDPAQPALESLRGGL